ncbi:PREDICTED: uncharacterized protein LOC107164204 [Diuraphis noxia]|uniref:uncharacterized protein LOC107164204 n=1 Tax=Diuraphis noxia TaxID=143948 RepID=UPI0007638026|nr:PREDICTED: uncharacterized protein LOC107164204 [Diuraphis noxia]
MSKNESSNSNTPDSKPKEKRYCPRSCVRYDNTIFCPTLWVCRMCLKCLLSLDACKNHVKICNPKKPPPGTPPIPIPSPKSTPVPRKTTPVPPTGTNQKNEDNETHYICQICDRVFSRRVSLLKHIKDHKKMNNEDSDSD